MFNSLKINNIQGEILKICFETLNILAIEILINIRK